MFGNEYEAVVALAIKLPPALLFIVLLYHWYVGVPADVTTETVGVVNAIFKQVFCGVVLGCVVIEGAEFTVIVAAPDGTLLQAAVFTIALYRVVWVMFE